MSMEFNDKLKEISVANKSLFVWVQDFKSFMQKIDMQFDPSHRLDHIERVANNVFLLTQTEVGFKYEVLMPALWLHDCVPVSKFSNLRSQASTISGQHAIEYLHRIGYPEEYLLAIQHAITAHSFSACIKPESIDAKILQDADRLDSLGAIGIARTFMLGGKFGNAAYHCDDPLAEGRDLDDSSYVLDHFHKKLFLLADTMQTTAGKKEAFRRIEFMQEFVAELGVEIGLDVAVSVC